MTIRRDTIAWTATVALVAAVAVAGAGPAQRIHAQTGQPQGDEPVVRVESVVIGEGLTGAVTVVVEGVTGLYGADVQLAFDPTVIRALDADTASDGLQIVLGEFLSPDFVLRNTADNEAGTVHFALTQINPSEAQSGSGELFAVLFEGVAVGKVSAVTITSATLATRNGEKMPSVNEDGEVRVVRAAQAPATPTAAPVARSTLVVPTGGAVSERNVSRTGEESGSSSGQVSPPPGQSGSPDQGPTDVAGAAQGHGGAADQASGTGQSGAASSTAEVVQQSSGGDTVSGGDGAQAGQSGAGGEQAGPGSGESPAEVAEPGDAEASSGAGNEGAPADSSAASAEDLTGDGGGTGSQTNLLIGAMVVLIAAAVGLMFFTRRHGGGMN